MRMSRVYQEGLLPLLQRVLTTCLTALLFWVMLPTAFAGEEDVRVSSKALTATTYDNAFTTTALSDEGNEDSEALIGFALLTSWSARAMGNAPRSQTYSSPLRTAYSIRAPPQ
jgi:hypothetical protein